MPASGRRRFRRAVGRQRPGCRTRYTWPRAAVNPPRGDVVAAQWRVLDHGQLLRGLVALACAQHRISGRRWALSPGQAARPGACPRVLADVVLLPQLVPETSPRADPVSRPRRTRRGRATPQSRSLRPSVLTPRWPRPPANAPPATTPAQLHQPARRSGHHLRQPCSARPRRGSVHHDHHAHPASAVGLRTTRRLPTSRPGVVSTPTPPDHSSISNPSPNRELRANRRAWWKDPVRP